MILSLMGLYNSNPNILAGITVPDKVDKNILIPELLAQCAELEILYPDASFFRSAVEFWSRTCLYKWQKLADTMDLEYDPISNYDRNEEWTDNSEDNPGSVVTVAQQGYENSGFVDASRSTASGKNTAKGTHKGRTWGNIGVTTSQQMLTQERSVANFNLYQIIIEDFKDRFCLQLY